PDGIMCVNFGASEWWGRRVTRMLREATGVTPLGFRNELQLRFAGQENTYLIGADQRLSRAVAANPVLAEWVQAHQASWQDPNPGEPSITDDWPYWYLPRRQVPTLDVMLLVAILISTLVLLRLCLPAGWGFEGHFFFLGAAFLLLEARVI